VKRRATVDITIVVRVWLEPHDDEPRSRMIVVGEDEELTARGVDEIERALRSLIDRFIVPN
jgi:hypothetical protein